MVGTQRFVHFATLGFALVTLVAAATRTDGAGPKTGGRAGGMAGAKVAAAAAPRPDEVGGYVSTYVIVRLAPGAEAGPLEDGTWTVRFQPQGQLAVPGDAGAPLDQVSQSLAGVLKGVGVTAIEPALLPQLTASAQAKQFRLDRYWLVRTPRGTDTPALAAKLNAGFGGLIELAETDSVGGLAGFPNDPSFSTQWNFHNTGQTGGTADADVDGPECWDVHQGAPEVILAVIDTGVQANHPDLIGRVLPGWNTFDDNNISADVHGHGTFVTGVAAANANDSVGVVGMNWGCSVLPVRTTSATGTWNYTDLSEAITFAANSGADVISMSLQGTNVPTQVMIDAVNLAVASDVVLIAASGNFHPAGTIAYPAKMANVMAIGASDHNDVKWSGSDSGPELDVVAPGKDIPSLWMGSGYNTLSGTSFATPLVSGLAALVRSYNPALDRAEVEQLLKDTAEDKGAVGWDSLYGWGRVNAHAAINAATPVVQGDVTGDGFVNIDDLFQVIGVWGTCPGCIEDFDDSGTVDIDDLFTVITNWT